MVGPAFSSLGCPYGARWKPSRSAWPFFRTGLVRWPFGTMNLAHLGPVDLPISPMGVERCVLIPVVRVDWYDLDPVPRTAEVPDSQWACPYQPVFGACWW